MENTYVYHPAILTPYVLIFIVCWLLLKLVDCIEALTPGAGRAPAVVRLVIVLVGLILVLI